MREQLKVRKERAILAGAIIRGREKHYDDLSELDSLAKTAGAKVVDRFQQKIDRPHPGTFIGSGKARMLWDRVENFEADVVIFDNDLTPAQIRELEKIIEVKVVDRSELILDIFATRAKTKQAKLQVELAQLEYTYPRLTRMWSHLDTVAGAGGGTAAGAVGGIGTRGTGEKQLEIDRRLVNKRITELKRDLAEIDKRKLREIGGRKKFFTICLVGYTNAGKSTLMNKLTGADVFVEDRLFATLDTRTKKWRLDNAGGPDVLLSDTVGFVKRLPHHLVASFKATLEEAVTADLLLHVVDASSEEVHEEITSVNRVLKEIDCGDKPTLMLLNKAECVPQQGRLAMLETMFPDAIAVSAKTGLNLDLLSDAVLERYRGKEVHIRVTGDAADGRIHSFLHANAGILEESYIDSQFTIEARLGEKQMARLRSLSPEAIEIVG